jgi:hypothetical protein
MSEINCSLCAHFKKIQDPNNVLAQQGQCFLMPPQAQLMPQGNQIATVSLRPVVTDKDYCHQFRAVENNAKTS